MFLSQLFPFGLATTGVAYFSTQPNCGIFAPLAKVAIIDEMLNGDRDDESTQEQQQKAGAIYEQRRTYTTESTIPASANRLTYTLDTPVVVTSTPATTTQPTLRFPSVSDDVTNLLDISPPPEFYNISSGVVGFSVSSPPTFGQLG